VCTTAAILLDLSQLFLKLKVAVHVLGNVVVSVLLSVTILLRSCACSQLVNLLLNVGLDDLDNVVPIVNWKLRRNVLSCLGRFYSLESPIDLLVHVVLRQAPRSRSSWWQRGQWQRQTPCCGWRGCRQRRAPCCCWRRWRRRRTPRHWGDGVGSKLLVNFVLDTSFTSLS
jgi:hypothetical protein